MVLWLWKQKPYGQNLNRTIDLQLFMIFKNEKEKASILLPD
jgi:hypothetical protein